MVVNWQRVGGEGDGGIRSIPGRNDSEETKEKSFWKDRVGFPVMGMRGLGQEDPRCQKCFQGGQSCAQFLASWYGLHLLHTGDLFGCL